VYTVKVATSGQRLQSASLVL